MRAPSNDRLTRPAGLCVRREAAVTPKRRGAGERRVRPRLERAPAERVTIVADEPRYPFLE